MAAGLRTVVSAGERLVPPDSHTLLFLLSVLAIVPLAALFSHATESVAAKTGDAAGGLLNATLGNLTELVIAVTALRAGEYMLVKASIAGAIVTNALFMLGASFLLGGLKHHTQEFNRAGARLQAACFCRRGCVADPVGGLRGRSLQPGLSFTQKLSVGLGGAAHHRLWAQPAVLAQDPSRMVCRQGACRGRRSAMADRLRPGRCWPA